MGRKDQPRANNQEGNQCADENIRRMLCSRDNRDLARVELCLNKHCKPSVVGWLRKCRLDPSEAEVMWKEALSATWVNICYEGKEIDVPLCKYIFGIVRNKMRNRWREKGQAPPEEPNLETGKDGHQQTGLFEKVKKWLRPRRVVVELKPEQWEYRAEPEAKDLMDEDILRNCRETLSLKQRDMLDDMLAGLSNEELGRKYEYFKKDKQGKIILDEEGQPVVNYNVVKSTKNRISTDVSKCVRLKTAERECFQTLDTDCQNLLRDRRRGLSWKEIARKHDLPDADSAEKAHSDCQKQLDQCTRPKIKKWEEAAKRSNKKDDNNAG